tara:strand:+ start:834 stop:1334 length:501 start_codon:yes stop_codon:yes gene_type:complete
VQKGDLMASTTFSGPVTSTAGFISGSDSLVSITADTTLTSAAHAGRTMNLNVASGATCTLPAASGTGNTYKFFVQTTVTSNSYKIQVANANDTMAGIAVVANDSDNSASIFETAAASDTITLDGTTTGGILGGQVELQDVASNVYRVLINQSATGTEATPFSAAVS